MSANPTTANLINYMSQRLLKVAELNTVLGQFGDSRALPKVNPEKLQEEILETMGWRFAFKSLITNSDWIRITDLKTTGLDLGGFDFDGEPSPLETHELSPLDLQALEALELF